MADIPSLIESDAALTDDQLQQLQDLLGHHDTANTFAQEEENAEWQQQTFPIDHTIAAPPQEPLTIPLSMARAQQTAAPMQPILLRDPSTYLAPRLPAMPQMIPDQSMGPSFDPRIGWYFPAIQFSVVATPRDPFPVFDGYLGTSPVASGTATPNQPPVPPQNQDNKRTALLREQVKNRLELAGKPFEVTKDTPLVKQCVCTDKENIKRPKNAWILYRLANAPATACTLGSNHAKDISKILAEKWRNETDAVKTHFFNLAEEEKNRHKIQHPNYKYTPGIGNRHRFGSVSCTCGAFEANMAASGQSTNANSIADVSALGLRTFTHSKQADGFGSSSKRKRGPSAVFPVEGGRSGTKRRSTHHKKTVTYAEPSDDNLAHNTAGDQKQVLNTGTGEFELSRFAFNDPFTRPAHVTRTGSLRNKMASPKTTSPNKLSKFPDNFDFNNIDWDTLAPEDGLFNDNLGITDDLFGVDFGHAGFGMGDDMFGEDFQRDDLFGEPIDQEANRRPSSRGQCFDGQSSPAMSTRSRAKSMVHSSTTSPTNALRRSSRKSTSQ